MNRGLMKQFLCVLTASMLAMATLSCDRKGTPQNSQYTMSNYEAAKADALNNVGLIREFKSTFGDNYLSYGEGFMYYSGKAGQTQWRASAVLYDRYQINIWLPVHFSENRRQIISTGSPVFRLDEFDQIEMLDGGRIKITYVGSRQFGLDAWEKIKASEGRIEEVFEDIKTDSPVDHFDDYVKDGERRVRK